MANPMSGVGMVKRLNVTPEVRTRALALTNPQRMGTVPIPAYIGRPQMVVISDSHGEVNTYLSLYEALPSTVRYGIDLGDKVDRGPKPIDMNYLLQTLRVRRSLGNHDAMWLAAGMGIKSQSIELTRWLLRYNEIDFLMSDLGVGLGPLRDYADKYFSGGRHRIDVKSKSMPDLEAAATYLKIIAEASIRFPEHKETLLNASDLRIRKALFFKEAITALTPTERDIYDRLTGDQLLSDEDRDYFEKLMGGLRELNPEEQAVVDHFTEQFLNNYSFYNFVKWMAGDGDLYLAFRTRQGYPCNIIATHATIPMDENGNLVPFNGRFGRDALLDMKNRIQLGLEAWRQKVEDGDSALFEMHRETLSSIGLLPWDRRSPLYARQMQTAARAVLQESTGMFAEPKEPFFTHFEKAKDKEMLDWGRRNIAKSFGFGDPNNFVLIRGHEPSKDGMAQVLAGGTVINIDAGMAKKYGGLGGALVLGTEGAGWLAYPSLEFTEVPLPKKQKS